MQKQLLTLGQLLRQARRKKDLSLGQVATYITRPNGKAISRQYIHALEQDRCIPSVFVLRRLAHILALDPVKTLAQAGLAAAVVQEYLQEQPDQQAAVIHFFQTAQETGFSSWEQLAHALFTTAHKISQRYSPLDKRQLFG